MTAARARRAGVIAAGFGERLRSASAVAKPLLRIGGRALIDRVLELSEHDIEPIHAQRFTHGLQQPRVVRAVTAGRTFLFAVDTEQAGHPSRCSAMATSWGLSTSIESGMRTPSIG